MAPTNAKDAAVLAIITQLLRDGLATQTEPFPETDQELAQLLTRLGQIPRSDLKQKLVVAGFVDKPYGPEHQRCMECMYFLVHRRRCDVPELAVPVEPDWWCRLWRI